MRRGGATARTRRVLWAFGLVLALPLPGLAAHVSGPVRNGPSSAPILSGSQGPTEAAGRVGGGAHPPSAAAAVQRPGAPAPSDTPRAATGPAGGRASTQASDGSRARDTGAVGRSAAPAVRAAAGVPVVVGPDTLMVVRTREGAFTPAERAAAIQRRLDRLARTPDAEAGRVRVVNGAASSDVVLGDLVLTTVTDADAAAAGVPRPRLAASVAAAMQRALREESLAARLRTILVGALFALLVALATVVVFRLVQRLFAKAFEALERGRTTWMPALRIQNQVLLSADHFHDALSWTLRLLRFTVLALLLYIAVPIVLSLFPWTRPYAHVLVGYILTPFATVWAALIGYVPNLFTIGAIVVVTYYLLRLIRLIFAGVARGNLSFSGFYPEWALPTYKLVRMLVLAFALIMVWPYLPGSESPAFKGVGVVLGLLISLGSASAISNAVGGVVLTYMRPFKVGDRVKIADTVGDVVGKDLLVTRVRTVKNVDVTIPNSMVLGSHIVNYSSTAHEHGLILNTTVTIGYDAPWRQVHELLIAAARATPGILADPAPFVFQSALSDFYVAYEINAYTDRPNRMVATYSALHANIQDAFNDAGVEIMSPHYTALRDGNAAALPPAALGPGYRAPAFRVEPVEPISGDGRVAPAAVRADGAPGH